MPEKFDLEDMNKKDGVEYKKAFICNHVDLTIEELDDYIVEMAYDLENLVFSFNNETLDYRKMLRRFLPEDHRDYRLIEDRNNLENYVTERCNEHDSFYSFFAEYLIGLVLRDRYDMNVVHALIDITHTLDDVETGVDACLYSNNNDALVLVFGESKFYTSYSGGMNAIISDFKGSISNKIGSFCKKIENNNGVVAIMRANDYEPTLVNILSNHRILFVGFNLHSKNTSGRYGYNQDLSVVDIESNIRVRRNLTEDIPLDYSCIMIHLPISDKKELIMKLLEEAKQIIDDLQEE